jgi:hypothetical protein
MYILRSLAMRTLIIAVILVAIWTLSAAFGWTGRQAKHSKRPYFKPACDGVPCRNTAECGTRCTCEFSGGPLGVCVAKPHK